MNDKKVYIGVDVAKDSLEVAGLRKGPLTVHNTSAGYKKLLKQLPSSACICLEATGGYERGLMQAMWAANLPVARVNPARVRYFARSKGLLAKTDPLDAKVLYQFAAQQQPDPTPPPSPAHTCLRALVQRRDQLVKLRKRENQWLQRSDNAFVSRAHRQMIKQVDRQIAQIEQQFDKLLESASEWKVKVDRLVAIQGVGLLSAVGILAYVPELGSLTKNGAALLAGLAPINRDSGCFRGQRHIQGGRSAARRHLYMCALVASRHNPVLSVFYQNMLTRGKTKKVALTAVMRKLIILMNRLLQHPEMQLIMKKELSSDSPKVLISEGVAVGNSAKKAA